MPHGSQDFTPGEVIDLPDTVAQRLMELVPGKVRLVEPQLRPGVWEGVQAGDEIHWVSPVVGLAGPATVLARSGQWLLVDKPSHEIAVPIVHESWGVRRVGHGIEGRPNPKGLGST